MAINISITVDPSTYLRDPKETNLGKKIIKAGTDLLAETGFQCFNFKQLAKYIQSTEASVYRYFENKHMLLVYLSSWYWDYLDYMIMINTRNITDPWKRLNIAISTIVNGAAADSPVDFIDQKKLHRVVIEHFHKVVFNKTFSSDQKESLFSNYKNLNSNLSEMIRSCNADFKYPNALASNIIKMALDHNYYAEQMCSMTEITNCMQTKRTQLEEMINYFTKKLLS